MDLILNVAEDKKLQKVRKKIVEITKLIFIKINGICLGCAGNYQVVYTNMLW